jgi:hypothetical protein
MDQRLAAVQGQLAGGCRNGVVGHGQEDKVGIVQDGVGLGKAAGRWYMLAELAAPILVAAGDRGYRPAGTGKGDGESCPHATGADEPDARPAVIAVLRVVAVG